MYYLMLLARHFDEKVIELYKQGKVRASPHSGIGHEAIGVGAFYNLRNDDFIQPHYRSRAAWLIRGLSLKTMMADVFGKRTGSTRGKSNYLHSVCNGYVERTGVIGSGIPIAVGVALAAKLRGSDQAVVCSFGDGATNRGDFHEALNFSAIWKLPVVFICENNQISITLPSSKSMAIRNISNRAAAYGFSGVTIDGNDVLAVYETVQNAVKKTRHGGGPTLIECKTFRLRPHSESGRPETRPKKEIEEAWKKEPIKRFENLLIKKGILTDETIKRLNKQKEEEIKEAIQFAEESPFPDLWEMLEDVYEESIHGEEAPQHPERMKKSTYLEALRNAIAEEMRRDKNVFLMGEDIVFSIWGATKGLAEEFGEERVRDTPISESAMVGLAVGAALAGMRPIVEVMYTDFLTIAMNQIVNAAAKMRYAYGGRASVPLVIRVPQGAYMRGDMYHSQSFESWFTHVPGLKVVYPSTPYDAKGLMKSAIRDNDPVIFFEHKLLYGTSDFLPDEEYTIPLGKADVKKVGNDVTIVATGLMVHKALAAAEELEKEGVDVEVVDPRTLLPIDKEVILESVKKTGKAVIIHEACKIGGVGGEIASVIAEEAFDYLDASVKRVGAPFTPVPFSPLLQDFWLSNLNKNAIVKAVKEIV